MTRDAGTALDWLSINVIRGLAIDAVEKAKSGHPGMPMGAAPMACVLWTRFLRFDPGDPAWPDRDRFVLSAGHGSMLLYALLHLTGFDLPLEELQRFRQWESRTPGHPEHGLTAGVETTTGPLGQGFGNAVGMALAERWLRATFNRPGHAVVDHWTYGIASDGDLMEGVQSEAASLAGHLGLGRLIVLYDANRVTIDGSTDLAYTENAGRRFEAYGWHVTDADGNDTESVARAIDESRRATDRPSLIVTRTNIGYGAPTKQDTAAAHGAPLGAQEAAAAKARLGLPAGEVFWIPAEVRAHMSRTAAGGEARRAWEARLEAYRAAHPELAAAFTACVRGDLPSGWERALPRFEAGKKMATREASGAAINALAPLVRNLIGGSADLMESNNTAIEGEEVHSREYPAARRIHFGVREHAMGAVMNGMALHGGVRPFGGTFLIFSDYMRPSVRLAALMGVAVTYVYTHDSIGLGEDGPTHQPVEQLMSLRLIPNLRVIRPADATETAVAWRIALTRRDGPTAIVLTRQKLAVLDRSPEGLASADGVERGGYVLADADSTGVTGVPAVILVGTGSEVHVCLSAKALLEQEGIATRVVSMPSLELFEAQPAPYREQVLPAAVAARVVVEAGATRGWQGIAGPSGEVLGLDRFGASAPGDVVMRELGFTAEVVVARARASMARAALTEAASLP
ncbi:MAG: transketolase [Gemmatimonadetes bacterium]|nr:transketolase [Gemmatimonadota bacterium]